MSIMAAGNLMAKFSSNLQPRFLPLSRLKNSGVRCFTADASDSAFPVRYVPKKRADAKQTLGSTSGDDSAEDVGMPTSPGSRFHGRNTPGRRSNISNQKSSATLLGDSEHEFSQDIDTQHMRVRTVEEVVQDLRSCMRVHNQQHHCSQEISCIDEAHGAEYMKVPKENFKELEIYESGNQGRWHQSNKHISFEEQTIDSEYMDASEELDEGIQVSDGGGKGERARSKPCRTRQGAEKLAIELLGKRAFTAMELRKKLISKQFPLNIVQAVIHDFLARGFINDRLYAETFCQSRWTSSRWGPRRVKHELLKKGVSEADVDKAVKLVFADDEDSDQNTNTKLSSSSIEQLYMQTSKQWQRSQNVPHETRKARVIRWLQYRGFDWGVVGIILKKLESDHPP